MSKKEPSWAKLANDLADKMIELHGFTYTFDFLLSEGYTKEQLAFIGYDEEMHKMMAELEGDGNNGIV